MTQREKKAARIKLGILNQTLAQIGKASFSELYVEQICSTVGISKVTFFKYFPQKEDVLMYYLRVWCFRISVELTAQPREGIDGIYYIFNKMSDECEKYPGLVLSLVGHLADKGRKPKAVPLRPAERVLLYPGVDDLAEIVILSLDQLLERFVLEAIFRKEITKNSNTRELTHLLIAVLYGSVITSHIQNLQPLKLMFKRNAETIIGSLS